VPRIARILLDNGLSIVKLDTRKMLNPKEWGWRFVAFDLRMPNGQIVEHYMPLLELEQAKKNGNHQLFEKWRNTTEQERNARRAEYRQDLQTSYDRYEKSWADALGRLGLDESAAAASWNSISASLESLTRSKLSFKSSAEAVPTNQAPSSLSSGLDSPRSSASTITRPVDGSLVTTTEDTSQVSIGAPAPAVKTKTLDDMSDDQLLALMEAETRAQAGQALPRAPETAQTATTPGVESPTPVVAADAQLPPAPAPRPPSPFQAAVRKRRGKLAGRKIELDADLKAAFEEFGKLANQKLKSGLDPDLMRAAHKLLLALVRRGVVEFEDAVLAIAQQMPDVARRAAAYIEAGWDALRKIQPDLSARGSVRDILEKEAAHAVTQRRHDSDAGERSNTKTEASDSGSTQTDVPGVAGTGGTVGVAGQPGGGGTGGDRAGGPGHRGAGVEQPGAAEATDAAGSGGEGTREPGGSSVRPGEPTAAPVDPADRNHVITDPDELAPRGNAAS